MTGLPVLRICLFEEPVFLIQMISGDFQCFTEPLEVYHFPFPQEPQRCQNIRVFCQIDEVFIGAAGFLLCCDAVRTALRLLPRLGSVSLDGG